MLRLVMGELLVMFITGTLCQKLEMSAELVPQDGFFNNLNQPDLGIVGSRLVRRSPAGYSDSAYLMAGMNRPNPLAISQAVHSGTGSTSSAFGRNAMLVFFTQLVLDEILSTGQPGCPPEYENLPLPTDHPLRNMTDKPMVYQRSSYDQRTGSSPNSPREQTNAVTSYLDGGVIYGTSRMWTNHLRSFQDGTLRTDSTVLTRSFPYLNTQRLPLLNAPIPRDHAMKPVTRLFAVGNGKGHQTPFLLALQVVWHRYHNKIATSIKKANPNLSDQEIFNRARKRVVAVFQRIVVDEWLPAFLADTNNVNTSSPLGPYPGYNSQIRPDISQEFRTAMNFRYSLMPSAVWTLATTADGRIEKSFTSGRGPQGETRNVTSIRLCNNFWDSQDLLRSSNHLDEILRGLLWTLSEEEDEIVNSDIRTFYYGPLEFSRLDAVAMEIQRDRDHAVGDLNSVLQSYRRHPVSSWAEMGPRAEDLRKLYPNGTVRPSDIDFFTGAVLLQNSYSHGIPSIFKDIIVEQLSTIREADRFWFENSLNGLFSRAELEEIRNTSFSEVLRQTTNLSVQDLSAIFTCTNTSTRSCLKPPNLDNDNDPTVDVCTPLKTYDYFTGSEISFALSFAGLFLVVPVSVGVLLLLARRRDRHRQAKSASKSRSYTETNSNRFKAKEWLGSRSGDRSVKVELDANRRKVMVRDVRGRELRFIDLRRPTNCRLKTCGQQATLMSLSIPGEVDLILNFEDSECCGTFLTRLRQLLEEVNVTATTHYVTEADIKGGGITRDERQTVLDEFFRLACLQIMQEQTVIVDTPGLDQRVGALMNVHLTRTEFAEALGMQPSSIFVRNIFLLGDSDSNGFLSFQEFIGLFGVFLKGSAEEKARLMFNVYDVHRRGLLTRSDFTKMIKSLLELSENAGDLHDVNAVTNLVDVLFREAGLAEQDVMSFQDFFKVFVSKEYESTLQAATLSNSGIVKGTTAEMKKNSPAERKSRLINSYRKKKQTQSAFEKKVRKRRSRLRVSVLNAHDSLPPMTQSRVLLSLTKLIEVYHLQIFWVTLYTLVTCGIFIERAYYYAVGREQAGLRRLSGAWTTAMIRGSASVIMFTYASLLLTMCRNLITCLRETFLHRFIPFDSAVSFHKYIALLAMLATIVHIVGHGTNLYCMCTQTTTNVNCFFREYFTASNGFATFHYWAFQTITGLAGVLVTVVVFVMYVFALQWARRQIFTVFWLTHSLYPLVYLLTFLHGIGRLVQDPLFPWYLIGPLIIFVLDRLVSVSRNRIEIPVLRAQLLPSDVIKLEMKRPSNFAYKSGQWVRIACLKLGENEYHPFTLTSAPHHTHLTLHIRAVGPWTSHLRQAYAGKPYPKLYLDGPFGEGHQDWYSCDVAVLVGGGIGVTPFASILQDIAFKSRTGALITCQKVYFLWVTRTQKSFEWMTDVIREVEDTDTRGVLDTHIFVTQFKQKYDFRTTMLYICERHFQKVEGRSLFTGLKATTHFGRPDFVDFLYSLQLEHPKVRRFGVFSCGPGPMTSTVQTACTTLNRMEGYTYTHHYENF